jgi:hypothetical protein
MNQTPPLPAHRRSVQPDDARPVKPRPLDDNAFVDPDDDEDCRAGLRDLGRDDDEDEA